MPTIRQKIGVGPETYVDDARLGHYIPGKPYQVDEAKALALKATGKYEDDDPGTTVSTWDGEIPEWAKPKDEPPAPDAPAVGLLEGTQETQTESSGGRRRQR